MTDRVETIRNFCRRCTLRRLAKGALALAVLAAALLPDFARAADQPLTNADVVQLVQAKLASRLIVQAITSAPSVTFSLGPSDLIALKTKGVPDDVISAMLERGKTAPSTAVPNPANT